MTSEEVKRNVGLYAVNFVKHGMIIGLGSGTTVYWFIHELGKRVQQGLSVRGVPTSAKTNQLAVEAGIPISDLNDTNGLSLAIDGADEIDPKGNLIKGGGGALLQEKIVAQASGEVIIIADNSKLVDQLGRFPLPVEVIPFGYKNIQQTIISTGLCNKIKLRKKDNQVFVTDQGHYILDCEFENIADALALNISLHLIPGVVETGLFIDMADKAVIGYTDGRIEVRKF